MKVHWERDEDGLACSKCGSFDAVWIAFVPLHPPEPAPGSGPVAQCTGTIVGVYCKLHAKAAKDNQQRE